MEGERNFWVCFAYLKSFIAFAFKGVDSECPWLTFLLYSVFFLDWPTKGHRLFRAKRFKLMNLVLYLRDSYVNRGGVKNLFVLLKIFLLSFRDFNFSLWAVKSPPHPPLSSCLLVWTFQWKWIIPFTNHFSLLFSFSNQVNINSNKLFVIVLYWQHSNWQLFQSLNVCFKQDATFNHSIYKSFFSAFLLFKSDIQIQQSC